MLFSNIFSISLKIFSISLVLTSLGSDIYDSIVNLTLFLSY